AKAAAAMAARPAPAPTTAAPTTAAPAGGAPGGGAHSNVLPRNPGSLTQTGGPHSRPQGGKTEVGDDGDRPPAAMSNLCSVNGFQAQQADNDTWLNEHSDLVLRDAKGDPVVDPDWDEMLLDTSTAEKRQGLAEIVGGWIQGCAKDGFDAVEIDNLDSYSRS